MHPKANQAIIIRLYLHLEIHRNEPETEKKNNNLQRYCRKLDYINVINTHVYVAINWKKEKKTHRIDHNKMQQ